MTREEFMCGLRMTDDVFDDEPLNRYAQQIADYDADRRELIKDQRALIEQQAQEIERLKSKVEEWIRRKNHIERAYRGYGTPDEEIAKKAAWMKGQT